MASGWIGANVSETFIGGNQEAALSLQPAPQLGVFPTGHALFDHGVGLIAFLAKQGDNLPGQILVYLYLHRGRLYWESLL
jgi:hypothetical protein